MESAPTILQLAAGANHAFLRAANCVGADYPARPVRLIVAFAPGGVTDTFARLMGQKLGERLGQQFLWRTLLAPLATSARLTAKAAPDGYTLLFAFSPMSSTQLSSTKFPTIPTRTSSRSHSL